MDFKKFQFIPNILIILLICFNICFKIKAHHMMPAPVEERSQVPVAVMHMSIFDQNRRLNGCGYKHNGKPIQC
ncbi:hypothetical protein FF38_00101 [Lucilia cuprina]|uniref:Uncharacterized protein n=1 Tax=Lucilia cuprina TaxID=7375 RepID=A0A0L0BNF9_LUCCU|nr:hypothetical protein CVS40_8829 [Lucilia cuprina]KNC20799.1 hypothetical protein FF38_00101 [Lucilia cuprina]